MRIEPEVYPDPAVDREAVIVRGICGAVLGAVAAAVIWFRCQGLGPLTSAALFVCSIAACTVGSIRHGDSFRWGLLRRRR